MARGHTLRNQALHRMRDTEQLLENPIGRKKRLEAAITEALQREAVRRALRLERDQKA
jgi:hypothetical protein